MILKNLLMNELHQKRSLIPLKRLKSPVLELAYDFEESIHLQAGENFRFIYIRGIVHLVI